MLRFLLYAFLIYLAYRVIFHLIIPLYRTTKQVKKQFHEMNQRMQDHVNQQQAYQQTPTPKQENQKEPAGDYIDFEDVK
jgi:Sec-independent protein translocase protein TatA